MIRRVTDRTFLPKLLNNLNTAQNRINEFQIKISTSQNINKPSDDPYNVANVIQYKSSLSRNDQFQTTLRESMEFLSTTTHALESMSDILIDAKASLIQGIDDLGSISNDAHKEEFDGFLKELLQQSQAKYKDQYVFGGTNTETKPFELNGAETAVIVNPDGIDGRVRREISDKRLEQVNISGSDALNNSVDTFQLMIDIRDAFANNDKAAAEALLPDLETALDDVLLNSTSAGKRVNRFEVLADRYQFEQTQTLSDLSQVQDINVAEVVTKLQAEETALQAALNVIGRLSQPTLLDYVR